MSPFLVFETKADTQQICSSLEHRSTALSLGDPLSPSSFPYPSSTRWVVHLR